MSLDEHIPRTAESYSKHQPAVGRGASRMWGPRILRALPSWRARLSAWSPTLLSAMVLAALGAHLYLLHGLPDPAENYWLDVEQDTSSYYLWGNALYRRALWLAGGLVVTGLLVSLLAWWRPEARRPAQVTTLLGAVAVLATQLLQPAFWRLGTGLPDWSWALPMRLSLIAVSWKKLAGDRPFVGTRPWKAQHRQLRNGRVHLLWQEVRLLGLVLVLGLGFLLLIGRRLRPKSHWWRLLLVPVALAAAVTATGLLPELSHVSLLGHLPTALLVTLAVALTVVQSTPDSASASWGRPEQRLR